MATYRRAETREEKAMRLRLAVALIASLLFVDSLYAKELFPPNVLVVVLDDVGVDVLPPYGATGSYTPNINALAATGVRFDNAWSAPVCSPTRALLLTGRYGFRTGVGHLYNPQHPGNSEGLALAEVTIAERLQVEGWETAAFGKWHLGGDPRDHGFDHWEGIPQERWPDCYEPNWLNLYYWWRKDTNGQLSCETTYQTTAVTTDAVNWIDSQQGAWFASVNYMAIHAPFHFPPASLCPTGGVACNGSLSTDREKALAALEAADVEIGRLVSAAWTASGQRPLWVALVGDNGSTPEVEPGTCSPGRAKATMYQGGIRVPLILWRAGSNRHGYVIDHPVGLTDLFATIGDLTNVDADAEDSVSMLPYLEKRNTPPLRSTTYAEFYLPNGLPFAPTWRRQAIRDDTYKLIRRTGDQDELYDLQSDPCENADLFPPTVGTPAHSAYTSLDGELQGMQ